MPTSANWKPRGEPPKTICFNCRERSPREGLLCDRCRQEIEQIKDAQHNLECGLAALAHLLEKSSPKDRASIRQQMRDMVDEFKMVA